MNNDVIDHFGFFFTRNEVNGHAQLQFHPFTDVEAVFGFAEGRSGADEVGIYFVQLHQQPVNGKQFLQFSLTVIADFTVAEYVVAQPEGKPYIFHFFKDRFSVIIQNRRDLHPGGVGAYVYCSYFHWFKV